MQAAAQNVVLGHRWEPARSGNASRERAAGAQPREVWCHGVMGETIVSVKVKSESKKGKAGGDRRAKTRRVKQMEVAAGEERRKQERRKQVDPTTCERDYTDEEVDFMKAIDDYKRRSGRQFPTWSEVLEVVQALGYRKVAEQREIDHAKRRDF